MRNIKQMSAWFLILIILLIIVSAIVILWVFEGGDFSVVGEIFEKGSSLQPPPLPD